MEWRDIGIVLSVKPFSENSRIVTVFNKEVGKAVGIVRNMKKTLQMGDFCDIVWRGRTAEQLGTFVIETSFSPFTYIFNNSLCVLAIDSVCTLCINGMADKMPHKELFESIKTFLFSVSQNESLAWFEKYVFFEMALLSEFGSGLDLSKCAVTGKKDGLKYVSPKTGCAVTDEAAGQYKKRLFPLPQFMVSYSKSNKEDIFYALNITGHFLKIYFYGINGGTLPLSRCYMLNAMSNSKN